jgi:hypothetical protein
MAILGLRWPLHGGVTRPPRMASRIVRLYAFHRLADGSLPRVRAVELACGHGALAGAGARLGDVLGCKTCVALKRMC